MSEDLLIRSVLAATVGVLVVHALLGSGKWWHRLLLALILAGYCLSSQLDSPEAGVVLVAVCATAAVARTPGRAIIGYAVLLIGVLAVSPTQLADSWDAGTGRDVVLVLAGGLVAVFAGGEVIGRMLHPLAQRVDDRNTSGLERAGRYIGWLERALLYGLLVAGAPGAAGVVLAIKSAARFPSFSRDDFAEYFLIGTLVSIAISCAIAAVVRAALGASPLFG